MEIAKLTECVGPTADDDEDVILDKMEFSLADRSTRYEPPMVCVAKSDAVEEAMKQATPHPFWKDDAVEVLESILSIPSNYSQEHVEKGIKAFHKFLLQFTEYKMGHAGIAHWLSTTECLVDRFRGGLFTFRDAFYSMIPAVMYRCMNMDESVNQLQRLRTFSGRGNVVIDARLYPFDNVYETTGVAYVSEDDLDSRWATRISTCRIPWTDQEDNLSCEDAICSPKYDPKFCRKSLVRVERASDPLSIIK